MNKFAVFVSAITFATAVCFISTRTATAQSAPGARQEGVPQFEHVFLIIGENTTYDHLNATNAPYLMSTIKPNAVWLTQYYAATHWSQANYVALISGQFTRCQQHDGGVLCHQNVDNLFHQLDNASLTWKTWLEGGTQNAIQVQEEVAAQIPLVL